MATLHVRGFPEPLYEKLRAQSAANGRSIGAEVIAQLQTSLVVLPFQPLGTRSRRRRSGGTPFEHFSPRARQIVVDAQDEARELGHDHIGTEHLLLALLRERTTLAARALELAGLYYATARDAVEEAAGRGEGLPSQPIPLAPAAKQALELALRESLDLGDGFIGPEHVLLGVARAEKGLGAGILARHGQSVDALRRCVRNLAVHPASVVFEGREPFHVVELDGSPTEWEAQLNEVAGRGYELVQIVERRAIFQIAGTAASMASRRLRT